MIARRQVIRSAHLVGPGIKGPAFQDIVTAQLTPGSFEAVFTDTWSDDGQVAVFTASQRTDNLFAGRFPDEWMSFSIAECHSPQLPSEGNHEDQPSSLFWYCQREPHFAAVAGRDVTLKSVMARKTYFWETLREDGWDARKCKRLMALLMGTEQAVITSSAWSQLNMLHCLFQQKGSGDFRPLLRCFAQALISSKQTKRFTDPLCRAAVLDLIKAVDGCEDFSKYKKVEDWAALINTSKRTLERGCKVVACRGTWELVQLIKLNRIHAKLTDPERAWQFEQRYGRLSIGKLAEFYGFSNQGRMAAEYREVFGANPVENLKTHLAG